MSRRGPAALATFAIALPGVAGCATQATTSTTTLAPLVTAGPPVTTSPPGSTIFSGDAAVPLLAAPPDTECAFGDAPPSGEITFEVGDRLFGVSPDGTSARCLALVGEHARGTVLWSPRGDRALLGPTTLLDHDGKRNTGFRAENGRVRWEYPQGDGLIAPTETNNTLVRRSASDLNDRTEVTFLAKTLFAVHHPSGTAIIASGTARDGTTGLFLAEPSGLNGRRLATTVGGAQITEVAADAGGDVAYFVAEAHGSFAVHTLYRPDQTDAEISTEALPAGALTAGPLPGAVAWRVGLCNTVTGLRARDGRDGRIITIGVGTALQGLSLTPVGWLDAARLVVAARPLGCDGPADVWMCNLLDSSATLLTKNVEFPAVRTVFTGAVTLQIGPDTQPPLI